MSQQAVGILVISGILMVVGGGWALVHVAHGQGFTDAIDCVMADIQGYQEGERFPELVPGLTTALSIVRYHLVSGDKPHPALTIRELAPPPGPKAPAGNIYIGPTQMPPRNNNHSGRHWRR